jgi:hypothetical protein
MAVNAATMRSRVRRDVREHPELAAGYSTLIRGFVFWGTIPWVVMGAGVLFGGVDSVDAYFRPRDGNPYVLAFFGTIFLVWILATYWLFFRGGAEMLVEYRAFFGKDLKSPVYVKLFWLLCLAGGILGVAMTYFGDFGAFAPR